MTDENKKKEIVLKPTNRFPHPNNHMIFGGFCAENQIVIYQQINGSLFPFYFYLIGKERKIQLPKLHPPIEGLVQQTYIIDSYNHTENTLHLVKE